MVLRCLVARFGRCCARSLILEQCSKCYTKLTWDSDELGDDIEPSIVLFLRDDDDGETNRALSKVVHLRSDQQHVEDKRNLVRAGRRPLLTRQVLMHDSPGGGFASLIPGEGADGIQADEQIKTGKFSFACHCGNVTFETDIHVRFSSCACKSDTRVANGLIWTGASSAFVSSSVGSHHVQGRRGESA